MITIFILLGLGFLCGGTAAIVDGLPYMVLERGFTQVIIGTVMAAAGVLMLALSWVLVELRRLKKTLSGAMMAMSVASIAGSPSPESDAAMPRMMPGAEDAAGSPRPGLAAAGAGALVGAGAVLAATQILSSPAPVEPDGEASEPDLFGAHGVQDTGATSEAAPIAIREASMDLLLASDAHRPVAPHSDPEPAIEAAAEPQPEAELPPAPASGPDADASETQEAMPAVAPVGDWPDAFAVGPGPSDIENPLEPESAPVAREADEFGMLRDSLSGLGLAPAPAGGRVEPSFSDIDRLDGSLDEPEGRRSDDLDAAASWMEPALQRRAPWFKDTQAVADEAAVTPATAEPEMVPEAPDAMERDEPEWPPHAREASAFEPAPPMPEEHGWDQPSSRQVAVDDTPAPVAEIEEPEWAAPEPAAPEAAAAEDDAAPAASDEGIVGAYQVGEAHFTIYADGSIQARTPDGDYSFTSMDELKIYLASEKSRLGV